MFPFSVEFCADPVEAELQDEDGEILFFGTLDWMGWLLFSLESTSNSSSSSMVVDNLWTAAYQCKINNNKAISYYIH